MQEFEEHCINQWLLMVEEAIRFIRTIICTFQFKFCLTKDNNLKFIYLRAIKAYSVAITILIAWVLVY